MRQLHLVILAGLLVLTATACGSDTDTKADATPGADVTLDSGADTPSDVPEGGDDLSTAPDTVGDTMVGPTCPATIAWPEAGGVTISFDPDADLLYGLPFPNDLTRTAAGTIDLTVMPNPDEVELIQDYQDYGTAILDGFGTNTAMYMSVDGALDPSTLPSLTGSVEPEASVLLAVVSPGDHQGERVPIFVEVRESDSPYFDPITLLARPVLGKPLRPATTYALVVTDGVTDATGDVLAIDTLLMDVFEGSAPEDVQAAMAPLVDALPALGLCPGEVVAATVFTTQDPTADLKAIRSFVWNDGVTPEVVEFQYAAQASSYYLFEGRYTSFNFQVGEPPYVEEGQFELDADGVPVVQRTESLRFALTVPRKIGIPAGGYPVAMYAHGTGGDWKTFMQAGPNTPALILADAGVATIAIDQPLHGDRMEGDYDTDFYSFNFLNPKSGRTMFRQSAADSIQLTELLSSGVILEATDTLLGHDISFNDDKIFFFGHSHGGVSGAITVGLEPTIKGALLSAGGGGFLETILLRKDPMDLKAMVGTFTGIDVDELDEFHPLITVVQTLVEATDPINYAPYALAERPWPGGLHLFEVMNIDDPYTPGITAGSLAVGLGLAIAEPVLESYPAFEAYDIPVKASIKGNIMLDDGTIVTAGVAQFDGYGHYAVFDSYEAGIMVEDFFTDLANGGSPTIAFP